MVYVLALGAALSNALTSVFQRMGVEDAPESSTMRLSLVTHALRRGVWLLGFVFMICGVSPAGVRAPRRPPVGGRSRS